MHRPTMAGHGTGRDTIDIATINERQQVTWASGDYSAEHQAGFFGTFSGPTNRALAAVGSGAASRKAEMVETASCFGEEAGSLGARFVEALAAKDHARLVSLLHPEVEFRGMTPGRCWEASTATQVVDEVLRCWFEDSDQIDEVLQVETARVTDRERVGYRLAVSNPDGRFLVEQQAYYETSDGLITWMRAMCSGFRPVADG